MKKSEMEGARFLNAVALKNAVLCAECEVVSDSPHDTCLVCGSRSLVNMARMFGGNSGCQNWYWLFRECTGCEGKPSSSTLHAACWQNANG
jgi:hypothetical protein